MRKRRDRKLFNWLGSLSALALLTSCANFGSIDKQSIGRITVNEPFKTIDTQFLEVNDLVPGFGGMYYDDAGILNAYVEGSPADLVAVKAPLVAAIRSVFGDEALREDYTSIPGVLTTDLDLILRTKVVPGMYEWHELYRWNEPLTEVLTMPGIEFSDIDESTNTLAIGYSESANLTRIQERITKLGVPLEAVDFVKDTGAVAGATLREQRRPTLGGLLIDYVYSRCTLGINVKRNGIRGFITNSHCSRRQFAVDSSSYYQADDEVAEARVGSETLDPAYFTNSTTSLCPLNYACRYSDANFVDYYDSNQPPLGRNYITAKNTDPPNLTITGTGDSPGEAAGTPTVGSYASKVGSTTGLTEGKVTRACERRTYDKRSWDDKPVFLLCTHEVEANFYYGDSGSPVLTAANGGRIRGVAWGFGGNFGDGTRYFLYSDLNGIRHELGGNLQTTE